MVIPSGASKHTKLSTTHVRTGYVPYTSIRSVWPSKSKGLLTKGNSSTKMRHYELDNQTHTHWAEHTVIWRMEQNVRLAIHTHVSEHHGWLLTVCCVRHIHIKSPRAKISALLGHVHFEHVEFTLFRVLEIIQWILCRCTIIYIIKQEILLRGCTFFPRRFRGDGNIRRLLLLTLMLRWGW